MRSTISGSMRIKGFSAGPANQNGQGTKLFGLITVDGGLEKKQTGGWGNSEMDLAFEHSEYSEKKVEFLQKHFKIGSTFMFTGQLGNVNLGHGNQIGIIISELGYGMKQETGNGGFNQGGGYNNNQNNGNGQQNNQGGGFGGNFQQNNGMAAAPQAQGNFNQNQMAAQAPQAQGNLNQNQQPQNGFPQQEQNAFKNQPAAQQPQNGFPMPPVGAGVNVTSGNEKDEFPF